MKWLPVALLLWSSVASAQGGPPGSTTPTQPEPATAPPPPLSTALPAAEPPRREGWIGIGAGMTSILGSSEVGDQAFGGVALEVRQLRRRGEDDLSTESVISFVFHDFETISDGYSYFFEEGERKKRLGAGWPVLIFVPFIGANAYVAHGWVSDPGPGGWWGGAGFQTQMFLRPSLDCFEFDIGVGPYAVLGYKFGARASFDLRAMYANPIYHSLNDHDAIHGITTTATLSIRNRDKKKK